MIKKVPCKGRGASALLEQYFLFVSVPDREQLHTEQQAALFISASDGYHSSLNKIWPIKIKIYHVSKKRHVVVIIIIIGLS